MTGHWLNLIHQDLDFLEKYSTKVKRTDTEEKRMELLERKYKRKMKAVRQNLKGFQVVLERIAPNLLVCVKNQNELKDLLEKTLKTKVDNLKRNEKKYQELMKVKFEVKMTSMKQRLATVMDIVKNTEHALMRMETAYDLVNAKCAEHKDKYETQVKQTETITTEYNNISKENENLKTQLAQKQEDVRAVKFEVKMTSMKQRLATVMDIVKNTEHALMRMETAYDLVNAKCAEHKDKYETQVKQTETITTEYNNISKENENLKTQLAQKQEDVRALEKTLREIKEENGNVADKIKELKVKNKVDLTKPD
ncbi:protein Hook homolog 3-like [Diaphorina citri]|uniref:Protein Hook homolog 3-like n=1 Tax=Diaphorina citri TaxID=121845 RepID=A0A1S3D091_DIACI|nr:protein Hook homolog 3-like [Diaphorina citri]